MTARKPLPRWPRPFRPHQYALPSLRHIDERHAADANDEWLGPPEVRRLRDWCNRWLAAWEARQEKP